MLPAIISLAWLSRVSPATDYWSGVFGPMMLLGIGMGLVFVPLTTASLAGVAPTDSGAASSMVNVMQQVGGALGLAVLVAVFGTASRNAAGHPLPGLTPAAQEQHVLAHGIAAAFGLAAIFNAASLLVIVALIRTRKLVPQRAEVTEEEPAIAPGSPAALPGDRSGYPVTSRALAPDAARASGQAPGLRDDAARAAEFGREVIGGERQRHPPRPRERTAAASACPGPPAGGGRGPPGPTASRAASGRTRPGG